MRLQQLEERLGKILGIGTTVSSVLLAAGLAMWMVLGNRPFVAYTLSIGLMVLIATPLSRVVVSAVGFAAQRDWQMLGMTALVLVSLLVSLAVAFS
jgi:uncharacterized membrane protein